MCSASEMGSQGLGIQWLNWDLFSEVLCVTSLDAASRSWCVVAAGDVAGHSQMWVFRQLQLGIVLCSCCFLPLKVLALVRSLTC